MTAPSSAAAPHANRVAGGRERRRVLLALPRPDHLDAYASLIRAVSREDDLEPVVVAERGPGALWGGVRYEPAVFYQPNAARGVAWLRFLVRRERAARAILARVQPAVLVVPSDVSDALLPLVEAARRRRTPVVYVQGAAVFAGYPDINRRNEAARRRTRQRAIRVATAIARRVLPVVGVHASVDGKGILGTKADRALVMSESQREVHREAGVPTDRLVVTGAPFIDALVELSRGFTDTDRERVRRGLGVGARPIALFLTKSLFRLGWASRPEHDACVRRVIAAVTQELPGWACVVKLHPIEAVEEYTAFVGEDPPVRVVKDGAVAELLLASDLVLSLGTSSPALAARVLRRPLVLVNLTASPMLDAHGDLVATTRTVRSSDDLRATLAAVRTDGRALDALRAEAPDDVWSDGHASERIVAQLRELLTPRSGERMGSR
jgi:hypothetical protein